MAFTAGTASIIKTTAPGGADYGVTFSAYLTGGDLNLNQPELRVTVLSDTDDQFVAGFKNHTFAARGIYDPTIDGYLFGMRGGTAAPTRYYPQGTVTGSIYYQFSWRILDYTVPTDRDEAVTFTVTGRASTLTRGTA